MSRIYKVYPKTLHFKFSAGTSRGYYTTRDTWIVTIEDEAGHITGCGECAPLPGLSAEFSDKKSFERKLKAVVRRTNEDKSFTLSELKYDSSILFAFESALLQQDRKSFQLFNNAFTRGEQALKINGLIWMGTYEQMRERIAKKLEAGFTCLKLKIGAINFEQELDLLRQIRSEFPKDKLTLRVDANGAFAPSEAMHKLEQLAAFDLHSIEQPIKAGQRQALHEICRNSPVPVALDEELIGTAETSHKEHLLQSVQPAYIVLKPSLHGGLRSTIEWIALAKKHHTGYWITSALESNLGLNVIAQFAGSLNLPEHQGLGTGQLYHDNLPFPALSLQGEELHFKASELASEDQLLREWLQQAEAVQD